MRAGRLNHRVTIQALSGTRNAMGEVERTFTPLATVWGAVEPLRGEELTTAQKISASITTRVVMRYRTDVNAKCRIVNGAKTYGIEAVINPEDGRRELQCLCREFPDGEPV
jgi:SPP1 family predicted phage head-tail adaptor